MANSYSEKYRNIEGYTAFLHNRVGRTAGGAAVYVRTSSVVSTTRMDQECPIGLEYVILQSCLPCSKLIIAQLYIPLNTCPGCFLWTNICQPRPPPSVGAGRPADSHFGSSLLLALP